LTTYYISVKVSDNEYKHISVPKEAYIYIKQLEGYIKYPELSKLKEVYRDRFDESRRNTKK